MLRSNVQTRLVQNILFDLGKIGHFVQYLKSNTSTMTTSMAAEAYNMAGINARNVIFAFEVICGKLEAQAWRRLILERPCNVVPAACWRAHMHRRKRYGKRTIPQQAQNFVLSLR